ncbi:type II toxin-antitoxin system RelB/DinJ family antitoxin [Pantoea endophytica]|uniref:Type II toxin-antitoxin system RelB/DinJ family antitoxin n=1 Tax=Pantoea sp. BJ2 TaxID=3141322 RepID=A0AAU7U446_9GAMM
MAMVNIRIDDNLKADGEAVFRAEGVSATEAITQLYRHAVQYRKLPFNDPRIILQQMRDAIHHASDVATGLNIKHCKNGFISVIERDAARAVFDGTSRSLEDNYGALQSACGGFLQQAWVDAANAMKGLLWMVSLCTEKVSGGLIVRAELNRATRALSDSYTEISRITERFAPQD